jgi:hypothetical protein
MIPNTRSGFFALSSSLVVQPPPRRIPLPPGLVATAGVGVVEEKTLLEGVGGIRSSINLHLLGF